MFRILAFCAAILGVLFPRSASAQALIYGSDAVASPPAVSLPTSNNYWFTNGNGVSVQGTQAPDYWFNKTGGELNALITGFGGTVSMTSYNQIATLLQASLVHMGDAPGQLHNVVHLGWTGSNALDLTIDSTEIGLVAQQVWVINAAHNWSALQNFNAGSLVPTQVAGDSSTNAASTAFVQAAIQNATYLTGNSASGLVAFPGGFTLEWIQVNITANNGVPATQTFTLPRAFTSTIYGTLVQFMGSTPPLGAGISSDPASLATFTVTNNASGTAGMAVRVWAIGK